MKQPYEIRPGPPFSFPRRGGARGASPRREVPEDLRLATHEAAHAVLACLFCGPLRVRRVTVENMEEEGGRTLHRRALAPGARYAILLAGLAADLRLGCTVDRAFATAQADLRALLELVNAEGLPEGTRSITELRQTTERLVGHWWPSITSVAEALLERGSLTGEEVGAIMGREGTARRRREP